MELPPITSSQNRLIGQTRRYLTRPREARKEGVLVADGIHLVQEALKAGLRCHALFATVQDRDPEIAAIIEQAHNLRLPLYRVLDHLFRQISPVETPQGIVGVFERPRTDRASLWGRAPEGVRHLAVAHGLQDPTNIGALTRSALASGMRGLITTTGTVDPFHHRALRASMGAAFRLPILTDEPPLPLLSTLKNVGYLTVALTTRADKDLTELAHDRPTALLLGTEGTGLDRAVEDAAMERVRIPMQPGVESLGVAAAGAVSFFWLRLVSRNGHKPGH